MPRLLTVLALLFFLSSASFAQNKTPDTPAYLKDPGLPAFNLLSTDSSKVFNTYNIQPGRPTVFIYFSPECDHCQQSIKDLAAHADSLNDATIYLATFTPLWELSEFIVNYKLQDFKNWRFGKDYQYFFPLYYGTRSVPFMVVYDKNKKLVAGKEGGFKTSELIQLIHQKSSY